MKRYRVVHTTGFKYSTEVVASYNEARLFAVKDDRQLVFASQVETHPKVNTQEYTDYFGTRTAVFEVLEPHTELTITSSTLVELREVVKPLTPIGWRQLEAVIPGDLALTDAVQQTRRTNAPSELVRFATKAKASAEPHEVAMQVMKFIHESVRYEHGVTGVHSVATEAWSKRVGVCQDFAHLALGALRAVGIPARYVSGYLHPSKSPVVGETVKGESHAWVEWFIGDWFGYDPTNDVEIADRHIVVGRGRDYDDVPPLRGVYAGPDASELKVSVEITREA